MASLTKVKINNIDTSITYVYDPLILMNFGSTLANTDVGFVFNRDGGVSSNVALFWNETTDRITIGYTSATGLPNSNISLTKYANVAADWYFGNLAGGTTNTVWVSANVLPTANAFYNFGSPTQRWNVGYFAATTLDLGGSQISVDPTNGFKFTVGGTGTATYLASNGLVSGSSLSSAGTITAVGSINTLANVLAVQVSAGSVTTTGAVNAGGNVLAQTGIFNYLDVNGNIVVGDVGTPGAGHSIIGNIVQSGAGTVWFNTPGNLLAAYGQFGQIRSDGLINTSANIMAATGRFGTVLSDGFINTSANVSAALHTGGSVVVSGVINTASNVLTSQITVFGNATIGAITTPGVVHNLVGNISQSGAGTIFFNTPGNVMAALGQFGTVNVSGYINGAGNISTPQLNAGQLNTTGNLLATAGTFNALTVNGLVNSTGNILATGAVLNALTVNGGITSTGFINTSANVSAATVIAGTMTTTGTLTAAVVNSTGNILATGATVNALTVKGNQSVTGYINVAGNVIATTAEVGSIESSGVIYANSTSAGTSTASGAIQVAGGIGVTKDSYFGGNLTLAGNLFVAGNVTYFSSNNVTFSDSLIYLADGNAGDAVDIGIVGHFINPGYQHTGLARDATDGVWKLFANVVPEPTTTIDFTNAVYSNLLIGNLLAGQATVTGLNSAGFINTSGNVSAAVHLGGQVSVSGLINTAGNILSTGAIHNSLTVNGNIATANIITTGAGQFSGQFNETTTTAGVYLGNASPSIPSPRIGLFNGVAAQNWQIDNYYGTFRWFTPGTTRMQLDPNGNLAVNGLTTINPGTTNLDSALVIAGSVTKGGAGYHDFLRVTNGAVGATNINKYFRLNNEGTLQIINSAYTANPFSLTDDGRLTISGNITAGSLTTPGAQHVLFGNVQINAIGSLQIPVGTTLQRPGSGIAGQIRFNTDTNGFEGYSNVWAAIGGGGGGSTPGGVTTTMQYNSGGSLGGIATMNYIVANGAVILSTGTSSTSTATGALQIIGGVGITENINLGGYIKVTGAVNTSANVLASQVSAGSVVTTGVVNAGGNVLATAGIFNALTVNGTGTVTTLNATGNIISTGAIHNSLTVNGNESVTGYLNVTGNVLATSVTASQMNTTSYANIGSTAAHTLRFGQLGALLSADTHICHNMYWTGAAWNYISVTAPASSIRMGSTTTNSIDLLYADAGATNWFTKATFANTAVTIYNNILPGSSNAYTVGSSTAWYSAVWGKAVNAAYADLAETYTPDNVYQPGTVLIFGGDQEVTISTLSHDTAIAGVVSTNPAYHMNAAAEGVAVALTGRVPTKVKGPVKKGDRVVASDIPGVAQRLDMIRYQPGCIIGKSLENISDDSIQTIEVVVGRL